MGWFHIGLDGKAGKKNEWFLFLIYLLHCHCTSTLTNCIKGQRNSSLLFFQMFILWAFLTQILEMSNLGSNTEDVGWNVATLPWCRGLGSCGSSSNEKPPGKKLSQEDERVWLSKNFSTELVATNPKHLGLAAPLNHL